MEVRHNRGGKLPRPQAHYENRPRPNQSYDESIDYKPKGRPYPIEKAYKFQGLAFGQILNITSHDPELWNSVINVRKYPILVYVWKKIPHETDPETMYKYLETFLGESTRALWESYKTNPLRRVNTDFVKIYLYPKHMELKKKKKKYKPYKKYNKRYFLKRSTIRKPYLDPNRHVKKYNPKIWFILLSLFFF